MAAQTIKRQTMRLKHYDYSQLGAYFVTLCTQNAQSLLGNIVEQKMVLNIYGEISRVSWQNLTKRYSGIELDYFVIMPNHMHGIVNIVGRGDPAPTLGQIIAYFKYETTKQINKIRNEPGEKVWQRNFYEHIVRNDEDLRHIREYVVNNPHKWAEDKYYNL